ncbi:hypothetical protein FH966_10965 [Lentibacillus cibarius]|uniref:Uncharacterized protein n=1 Tax=Lentibacillus cibarius TaxID=2583219 RepID=A0A549YJW8_9BACI|nr:hypothetical protein [Lentibacillus cibarius]TRM12162.1 hypothetical protein FH966_10965 [Lentibacillus cibarius]
MGPLIRRELDGMVTISIKNSFQTYLVLGLVLILLMWLLGPNVTGLFNTDMISLLLFITGFLSATVNMLSLLESDDANNACS